MKKEKDAFDEMCDRWPSAVVARTAVKEFSGGLLSPSSLAVAACNGNGPPQIRVGIKVVYRTVDLAAWMRSRVSKGGKE